jgi:hypothetical protein
MGAVLTIASSFGGLGWNCGPCLWLQPKEVAMKIAVIAAAFAALVTTASFAYDGFWVIKDSRQSGCSIVTSNPVIDGPIGPILWGSGPYRSQQDAELAISTIGSCN